jgi:hypothetical protein
MNGFHNAFGARRRNRLWRGSAFFGLLLLVAAPVAAKQCPRGQIFRVSKNMCMDRNEAIDLGIVHGAKSADKPAPKPAEAPEPSQAAPSDPIELRPAAVADDTPKDIAKDPAKDPAKPLAPPPPSPYGELTLESFAKP